MKSAYYSVTDSEGNPKHYLVVYDESEPCVLCGLPVLRASVSATAICGWCDCGKPRNEGAQTFRKRMYERGEKRNPWANRKQEFLFDTRSEADQKMYELHQQGIEGWPHVIERISGIQP